MSSLRQKKWNWGPHFPKLLELYNRGLTIPQIHTAIQCPNFEPCLRAVYNEFNARGYPTDHKRSSRPHHDELVDDAEAWATPANQYLNPAPLLESNVPRAAICIPIEEEPITILPSSSSTDILSDRKQPNGHHEPQVLQVLSRDEHMLSGVTLQFPRCSAKEGLHRNSPKPLPNLVPLENEHHRPKETPSGLPMVDSSHQSKRQNTSTASERQEVIIQNLRRAGLISDRQHSGGRTRPRRSKEAPEPTTDYETFLKQSSGAVSQRIRSGRHSTPPPAHARPMRRIRSLFDMGHGSSKTRGQQDSTFADNDSGYYSGRKTPSTIKSRDSLTAYPQSLTEFWGLYRVSCYTPHESKHHRQSGDKQPCRYCGCSAIHILAWSANHLKVQDFEAELRSNESYDLQALDAAGNSALHYAAVSGASYAHLKALVDAGAPLYARNTANQNFLHCLRPCDPEPESCSVDCFKFGLIDLLKLVDPKTAFSQQDNDGQTILHVLAFHVTEPELRDRTFRLVTEAGYPPIALNRFGKSPKDIWSPSYKAGQTMFAADTFNKINASCPDPESSETSEWEKNVLKQMNARNILIEAHHNPHYMDSANKDTVLHALSRVSVLSKGVMQKNDIIQDLRHFVSKGVNLNRHNRDGHHSLAAFICNQDFRGSETGATMAKYIDILLWKGGKHGDSNDINVNMMTRNGSTALHEAASRAQSDTVRSLIEAGANVNARLNNDPRGLSVLQATFAARDKAVLENDRIRHHDFVNVISHLEHAGAVANPTPMQERGRPT